MRRQLSLKSSENSDKNEKSNPDQVLEAIWNLYPLWSFKHYDFEHEKWTFKVAEKFIVALKIMSAYEKETWGEMEQGLVPIGGKSLCVEAIERIAKLGLDKLDYNKGSVFSLPLLYKERLWGIPREDGVFFVLWCDPDNEVSSKK
jgi:hypothetical protein